MKNGEKIQNKKDLERELAGPDAFGIRQGWNTSEIASVLDPAALARLILNVKSGSLYDYLTLAEEMEERDLHYRSVLGTRKLSAAALDVIVEPAGDDKKSIELADAVKQDILDSPHFSDLETNALDAIGKGFSVIEIMWDTSSTPWRPVRYEWRDPHWFEYDQVTGRKLLLREGGELLELEKNKFIIHQPLLKSGLPLRSGIALPVAYYHLMKSYDMASWSAFLEVFGYPLRIGKYGKNADAKDIDVLKSAVRNLGRDVGAVIPDDMIIEIVTTGSGTSNSTDHFEKQADWVDKQISKGVLGQTATTEGTPGKLGGEEAQEDVRLDIKDSDARQLAATLNRDLVRPYIDLNWGKQEKYPRIKIPVPRPEDVNGLIENVSKLVPLGLPVKKSELYSKLGLTAPGPEDDVLTASESGGLVKTEKNRTELNRQTVDNDEELCDINDWEPYTTPLYKAVSSLVAECNSFEDIEKKLPELAGKIDSEKLIHKLALDMFSARAEGYMHYGDE